MHQPTKLATGTVDRSVSGARWWQYRRPDAERADSEGPDTDVAESAPTSESPHVAARPGATDEAPSAAAVTSSGHHRSGATAGILAAITAGTLIALGQWSHFWSAGRFLVPLFALLVAAAFVPTLTRRHPDEPWLGQFLMWGVAFKIFATLVRYFTFGGGGDAGIYHDYGLKYLDGTAKPLGALRRTGFVDFVVAHLYAVIGADKITAFFVFGLFGLIGSYLWYRATATAVPFVNRRMYCAVMFFLPSIAFWPASVGKEALMQFGIGAAALGTAFVITGRLWRGLAVAAPGGYLMWAVRPHLLALVVLSAAVALVIGRIGSRRPVRDDGRSAMSVTRPLASVIIAFLAVFAISQAMHSLGMQDLSLNSIQAELNDQAGHTNQGRSRFGSGGNTTLTPLSLPQGAVTVLLRPFIWEVETGTQIIASIEAAFITYLVITRRRSLLLALTRARSTPFLLYCWTLTALYSVAFSAFSNMGLLVRQRSLVLPALFVLLCVEPALARRTGDTNEDAGVRPVNA